MTPRRLIYVLGAAIFAVALLLFGLLAEKQRRDTFADADRLAQSLAETLAGHAERLLDVSNVVASVAVFYASRYSPEEIAAAKEDQEFFQRFIAQYRYIEALWITGADGMPLLTSRGFPAPKIDTSDREHFMALRDGGRDPFISKLLQSRLVPDTNIVFARRLNDENGKFLGIVQVVLQPDYFYSFYEKIKLPYPVAITLFRDDLAMLVRYPRIPATEIQSKPKWDDATQLERNSLSGRVTSVSTVDGIERAEAYLRVSGSPLLVSVGFAVGDIRAQWLGTVLEQAAFAVAALAALLVLLRLALLGMRREEAAVSALKSLTATLESRVAERTAELAHSNERLSGLVVEKERLLRELNHRIKNSLQTISSLIDMQGRASGDPTVAEQLSHASRRVQAVARVHQRLYSAKSVEILGFGPYLRALCADLGTSLAVDGREISVRVEAAERDLAADTAISLGLIVSEAVTNAAKHAYRADEAGAVEVRFSTLTDGRWQLGIADHGAGLDAAARDRPRGLGMQLIHALSDQIDAKLEISSNGGTQIVVTGPAVPPGAAGAAGAS